MAQQGRERHLEDLSHFPSTYRDFPDPAGSSSTGDEGLAAGHFPGEGQSRAVPDTASAALTSVMPRPGKHIPARASRLLLN